MHPSPTSKRARQGRRLRRTLRRFLEHSGGSIMLRGTRDRVFFEILNEPEMRDAIRTGMASRRSWRGHRRGVPTNTIIAAGARWDDDDDLVFLEPLPDPMSFTSSISTSRISSHTKAQRGERLLALAEGTPLSVLAGECRAGCSPRAGGARFHAGDPLRTGSLGRIAHRSGNRSAADWANRRNVPLICNEFGVYRALAEPQDRAAWIKDVRTSLERHNIGWAMWDYSGSFGVVTNRDTKAKLDEVTFERSA